MDVSIVIPAYNSEKTIEKTIKACLAQTYTGGRIEIIIVDDGSIDNTKDIVAKYPVKLLMNEHGGAAKSRNTGWRAASGEFIFFTDSDCVPCEKWIEELIELFDSNEVGAVGGTYGIMNPESLTALCIHNEIQFRHSRLPEYVRYLGTFNLVLKKTVLEEVGGFDESFLIACSEDADLTYRISDRGYKLKFTGSVKVGHFFPENSLNFLIQQFKRGYWMTKLMLKNPGKLGKDDYSVLKDAVQPPLFFLIIITSPLIFLGRFLPGWLFMNVLAFFINYEVVIYALKKEKKIKVIYLFILLYLRGFFWAMGFTAGSRFLIDKIRQK